MRINRPADFESWTPYDKKEWLAKQAKAIARIEKRTGRKMFEENTILDSVHALEEENGPEKKDWGRELRTVQRMFGRHLIINDGIRKEKIRFD